MRRKNGVRSKSSRCGSKRKISEDGKGMCKKKPIRARGKRSRSMRGKSNK